MTKPVLEHVLRFEPPWRVDRKTECGHAATDVAAVIDQDELIRKVKDQGQQRAEFSTCVTCWERSRYAKPWAEDPVAILRRETARYGVKDAQLESELRALTLLWQAHCDEYDETLRSLGEVNDLAEQRARKRRSAR